MKSNKFVILVLLPVFAWTAVFLIAPLFYGLGVSLFEYNPVRVQNPFVGLKNYYRLFADAVFRKAVKNTLVFVATTVTLNIVFTLWISTILVDLPWRRWRNFFRTVFFIPCIAPLVTSAVVWNKGVLVTQGGLLNSLLGAFGIAPVNWLGDQKVVMAAIVLFTLWADFGYNTVLFCAGLEGIPRDFLEAADIDGAGPFRKFMSIRLPLLGRTFVFVLMMTIISYFQMIVQFMVLVAKGGVNNSATTLAYYIYKNGFIDKNMGYASSVATILFAIIFVVSMIQRRLNKVDWEY